MFKRTLKLSVLMYKMWTTRKKYHGHRKYLSLSNARKSRLRRMYEIRRSYSRVSSERFFLVKTLTEAYAFQINRNSPMWWENVKNKFTENQWLKYFRMGKETFSRLVDRLVPHLNSRYVNNVSLEKQVAITLISFASGKSNKYIGHLFAIPKSDVSIIIEKVSQAIMKLLPHYLKVPDSSTIKENIKEFEQKWGFPQCAGVLGSIHIPLRTSNLPENASDYINSDSGHSMILQGIVDASYKFWDINAGWPGSVPESRVLTSSTIWLKGQDRNLFPDYSRQIANVDIPVFILAGSSYPLSHWVIRPFLNESESEKEKIFNEKFTFAYNASEIAFKRLKARWNCLVIGNICSIEVFPMVITACCILHNMCEINKEMMFDEWIVKAEQHYKQPIPFPCNTVIGPQAENIREAVKEYFVSANSEV
ncbi:putative nuclease HARBI1, partial [Stegodyphus mimosarum]